MARCRLSSGAREGLYRIVASVETRFGPQATERTIASFSDALELIAAYPDAGHRRPDLTEHDRLRFWSVGPSLVAYLRRGACVEVVAIERAEVDWRGLLEELVLS